MFAGLVIKAATATAASCPQGNHLLAASRLAPVACNLMATTKRGLKLKDTQEKPLNQKVQQSADVDLMKAQANAPVRRDDLSKELQEFGPTNRGSFYPGEMEWLDERLVRISKPTKNVMQSGTAYINCWKIEFNSQKRWVWDLMGWTASADPVSNLSLTFPTKEAAIEYCERNELQWFVEDQPERKIRKKSYADNFSWNKRTRLGNK